MQSAFSGFPHAGQKHVMELSKKKACIGHDSLDFSSGRRLTFSGWFDARCRQGRGQNVRLRLYGLGQSISHVEARDACDDVFSGR